MAEKDSFFIKIIQEYDDLEVKERQRKTLGTLPNRKRCNQKFRFKTNPKKQDKPPSISPVKHKLNRNLKASTDSLLNLR